MKILDDWKVYGGVSDLKQQAEGIPVSQVIINSNYSDDHDDYDIALMKLSRPLTLSGDASGFATGLGWAGAGVRGCREWLGTGRSERQLRSPRSHSLGCRPLEHPALPWSRCCPRLAYGQELVHPRRHGRHPAVGSAVRPPSCHSLCPVGQWRGGWPG